MALPSWTPERQAALRSWILFLVGLALAIREVAFAERPVDPTLLLFYGGMMGLGPVLSRAERKDG